MAAEQLLSAFPSSPTAALRLTPPFAAGRRRKRELGCQLAWELSCELQRCSWPACREPQTQTPVGWRLAERHKPTCPGPLGSDLGTWPHLETEPPTTAGGARGAAEWLAVRRAAPLPQSNPPQHLVPGQTLPRWQGPRQVSTRARPQPRPPCMAWTWQLGPSLWLGCLWAQPRPQEATPGFIFISAALPKAREPALRLLPVEPPP